MRALTENYPSAFAQLIDKLKDRSELELKLLYNRLQKDELIGEWKAITSESNFDSCSDEDIVKAIQANRYKQENV